MIYHYNSSCFILFIFESPSFRIFTKCFFRTDCDSLSCVWENNSFCSKLAFQIFLCTVLYLLHRDWRLPLGNDLPRARRLSRRLILRLMLRRLARRCVMTWITLFLLWSTQALLQTSTMVSVLRSLVAWARMNLIKLGKDFGKLDGNTTLSSFLNQTNLQVNKHNKMVS